MNDVYAITHVSFGQLLYWLAEDFQMFVDY